MALLLGWQWWITIYLVIFFFAIVGGVFWSIWVISERRQRPPRELGPGGRGRVEEPRAG